MRRACTAIATACLLAGCAAGPDFVRPAPPPDSGYLPASQPAGGAQVFHPGAAVAPDWWRMFGSPELDRMMRAALANNGTLQAAQAALRQSQEELRAGRGVFWPQLDLAFSAQRQKAAPLTSGLTALRGVFNVFTLGGTISYLLDVAGANRRTVEALGAQADFQRSEMLATWLSLSGNIATTSIARAAYAAQIAATRELVRRQAEQRDIARTQAAAGIAPFSNVLSIESQLASSRAQLPALQQRYDQATHLLATLVGRSPSQRNAPPVALDQLTLPRDLPLTLPSELVRRRPDILSAEARLHVASANIGVATAALFPKVSLAASYSTEGREIEHMTGPRGRFWQTGAVVDLPLFHGGTLAHQRDASVLAWRGALANYRQTVLAAFAQVADALSALGHDTDAVAARQQALDAARQALTLLEANYRAGLVSYLDVLAADAQLQRAQIDFIQLRAQQLQDSAALYLALGGGWWGLPAHSLQGPPP